MKLKYKRKRKHMLIREDNVVWMKKKEKKKGVEKVVENMVVSYKGYQIIY